MKKIFYILLLPLLAFAACVNDTHGTNYQDYDRIGIGDAVPRFTIAGPDGTQFSSQEFQNRRSLIILFQTTCPDCQKVLPVIDEVWRSVADDDNYRIVGFGRGQDNEPIDTYWKANDFGFPWYADPRSSVYGLFATSYVPRIYLVDPSGVIRWMETEKLSLSAEKLLSKLKSLE